MLDISVGTATPTNGTSNRFTLYAKDKAGNETTKTVFTDADGNLSVTVNDPDNMGAPSGAKSMAVKTNRSTGGVYTFLLNNEITVNLNSPQSPVTQTIVSLFRADEGMRVNIQGWHPQHRYQIWSYCSVISDVFLGTSQRQAEQWVLSMPYTAADEPTTITEPDGSISFLIDNFVSPDANYTVAVRVIDADGKYIGEFRDAYTREDVGEVVITKVLVDGVFTKGKEVRAITPSSSVSLTVIDNGVENIQCSAEVVSEPLSIEATTAGTFLWNTATVPPGTYTVRLTADNGVSSDTKTVVFVLYEEEDTVVYAQINSLGVHLSQGSPLPSSVQLTPEFSGGSFYFRVSEPGRSPFYTSGLFDDPDNIAYSLTKFGVYHISGYVNREYEVRIGNHYDDGIIETIEIKRSDKDTSTVSLAATEDLSVPILKSSPILFTASADIAGIGDTQVLYSFWRYDAKGYTLVRDWSSSNTLNWTPGRVGVYNIEVRAKGADAGSYEARESCRVEIVDLIDQKAQGVTVIINEQELNNAAVARKPLVIEASAQADNGEDLLYKFVIADNFEGLGSRTIQQYSPSRECLWVPRKSGEYRVSVLIKNEASFGAYDAMETIVVTVN